MKAKLKKKWIAALRGGEYKQATGYLEVLDAHGKYAGNCCIGVLCRVYGFHKSIRKVSPPYLHGRRLVIFDKNITTRMCSEQLQKVGLEDRDQVLLIGMNDYDKADFDTIAAWIEKKVAVSYAK